jgi:tRNA dimethylallyltransferase
MANRNAPCLAIAGPTASGKTAAALALARALAPRQQVEIISVDSALVYRGMDIGTAKPSPQERAQVTHHLIDIRDPVQAYSAAEFVQDATALINAARARGALPVLVGGTMLYFKALGEGLDPMPAADPAMRAELEALAQSMGWPALHAELARVDPVTAGRLAVNDSQRIQRALEVYRICGRPLSSFHTQQPRERPGAVPIELISLEPLDRAWLHDRIALRFDVMLHQGLVDEVVALRGRGDLHPELPSMRCVGYRQAWEALSGATPMSELRDRGIFATRQLAKRQITWLRSMHQRHIVACDEPGAQNAVLALAQTLLEKSGILA